MLWHAYVLMLLVMTFNYPILIMICAGLATGHLIFEMIKLPELPMNYKQIAGTGVYIPEADNCCSSVGMDCANCQNNLGNSYNNVQTLDSEIY